MRTLAGVLCWSPEFDNLTPNTFTFKFSTPLPTMALSRVNSESHWCYAGQFHWFQTLDAALQSRSLVQTPIYCNTPYAPIFKKLKKRPTNLRRQKADQWLLGMWEKRHEETWEWIGSLTLIVTDFMGVSSVKAYQCTFNMCSFQYVNYNSLRAFFCFCFFLKTKYSAG